MFLFADGMNRSLHSKDQQADLSWAPEGWEHPGNLNELEMRQHQGGRSEWDWEAPPMPSQNPNTGASAAASVCDGSDATDAARRLHLLSGLLRPCYGLLPSGNTGYNLSPDKIGLPASSCMHPLPAHIGNSGMHGSMPPSHPDFGSMSSNFPGVSGGCIIQGDLARFDTRRHLMGIMGMDQKSMNDFAKPHDLYSPEGHAGRIGLNLGVRTYFSTEDSLFGRLSKRARATSPGSQVPMCQAEGCKADLSMAKHYHRRHKVCELHSKAVQVVTNGQNQRFCQQCSRFHPLSEFDEGKRSCRKRLADHNRRRRKPQLTSSTVTAKSVEPLCVKTEECDEIVTDQVDGQATRSSKDKHVQFSETKDRSPSEPAITHDQKAENLQLLNVAKGECRQSVGKTGSTLASSTSQPESSQALTSSISVSSPVSFTLKNNSKGHLSAGLVSETSQDAAVYHHLLQGMCRSHHLGPSLSLSSSTTMQGGGQYIQRPSMPISQSYSNNGVDNTPPWLKTMDLNPGADQASTNRDQTVCLDSVSQIGHQLATSIPSVSNSQQLLPSSIHTLLPLIGSSQAMAPETSESWILDSVSRQKKEHSGRIDQASATLTSPSGLERHQRQFIRLETAALPDDGTAEATTRAPIMNFLQQKPNILNSTGQSEESDSADEELSKLRFSDQLHVLKSLESIYADSRSSFL